MRRVSVILGIVALAGAGMAGGASAGPADLASHKAIYSMGLATTKSGSGIADVSGSMSYEFADSCDGWTVESHIATTYSYAEGGQVASSQDFLTWESKDGLKYRFRVRNLRDGEVTEEIEGSAELKGKGQGGTVTYLQPEPRTLKLPKGTIFPTAHTIRLLEAAKGGNQVLLKMVFDGSGLDGPFEVNAMIGKALPGRAGNALTAQPAWPVKLAFFPAESKEAEPEFEMGLEYLPNGIAQSLMQSFKNFSLKGDLKAVEALPRRGC